MQNDIPSQAQPQNQFFQRDLPDAGAVQVLGILSIIFCGLIGVILAIIALSKASEALRLYQIDPTAYTPNSLSKVKAGKTCAIVSLCLLGAVIFIFIMIVVIGTLSY